VEKEPKSWKAFIIVGFVTWMRGITDATSYFKRRRYGANAGIGALRNWISPTHIAAAQTVSRNTFSDCARL